MHTKIVSLVCIHGLCACPQLQPWLNGSPECSLHGVNSRSVIKFSCISIYREVVAAVAAWAVVVLESLEEDRQAWRYVFATSNVFHFIGFVKIVVLTLI